MKLNKIENLVLALEAEADSEFGNQARYKAIDLNGATIQELSAVEWKRKALALASKLSDVASPGDRVLLPTLGGLDFHIAFLGCAYAGLVAVPVPNPSMGTGQTKATGRIAERIKSICRDCAPKAVVMDGNNLHLFKDYDVVAVDVCQSESRSAWEPPGLAFDSETVLLIQYTSGSTSEPRGTVITHANWLINRRDASERGDIGRDTTIVTWLPLFHDMGIGNGLVLPLVCGASLSIMEPRVFVRSPLTWLKEIEKYSDVFNAAPDFAFHMCVDRTTEEQRSRLDLTGWRTAVNGSEPVRVETIDRFVKAFECSGLRRETMRPGYGLAECTLGVTMAAAQTPVIFRSFDRASLAKGKAIPIETESNGVKLVGCGTACGEINLAIVDPDSSLELAPNEVGEIWVDSPSNSSGYWSGVAHKDESPFGAVPIGRNSNRKFVRTGDLGFVDEEGELFITGRRKDVLIIGGENFFPQDAESAARSSHPAFTGRACSAWTTDFDSARSTLVVVMETTERDAEVLKEATRAVGISVGAIIPTKVVTIAVPLYSIPRTTSGKIRRRDCAKQVSSGELEILSSWGETNATYV
ncbi:fatty acyl-AMP ligase [Marinobacter sp. LN3S78]|uniref:fatty acyl-AMP ligase n=1 Tax=Marinobacter sp. LN3S78 TaxID=3382300 RepID=UPI00387ADA0E